MKKTEWVALALLPASSGLLLVNFELTQLRFADSVVSLLVGIIASLLFLGSASTALGRIVFMRESMFFRAFLGVTALLAILALTGMVLIISGVFTGVVSLVALIIIAVILEAALIIARRKKPLETNTRSVLERGSKKNLGLGALFSVVFVFSVFVAFRLLLLSRTGEGELTVWLTIPSYFLSVYLIGAASLVVLSFFTDLHISLKLAFISAFSFLSHSLFLIVWYPGRFGDPWSHLGEARYIVGNGMPYAWEWTLQNYLWLDLLKSKAYYSLVVFFNRMFLIDIYWIHAVFIPLLWSIFFPLLAYKTAELLTAKRSSMFPLLAAVTTLIFPSLVLWGAVSVPNSFSFIFLFVSLMLLLLWMRQGGRQVWLLAFLAAAVSITHPQAGLFAFMFLFFGTIIQKTSRKLIWVAGFVLMLVPYPLALYVQRASFNITGLFEIGNLFAFESEILTVFFALALVGLVLGIRRRLVDPKSTYLFFVFYIVVLFEFYFTKYGMSNLPFDAERVLVMSDTLLTLFVPLGLLSLLVSLGALSKKRKTMSLKLPSVKISEVSPRIIGIILIGLFLSFQLTASLYKAYPQREVQEVQPSAYEVEAIQYINTDTDAQYVVLCDPSFAVLASGFLGAQYTYGVYGSGESEYPTTKMYSGMTLQPSLSYMKQALTFTGAKVCYFVISVRAPNFEQAVERTSEILPVNNIFGNGKLYVFKYPSAFSEKKGPPVEVFFDDADTSESVETRLSYLVESEINATLSLSGHISYNVTGFPGHWAFIGLTLNNHPEPFDDSSDVNTFVYIKDLLPQDRLTVNWVYYQKYTRVGWKENSFKRDWHPSTTYTGIPNKPPTVTVNGSVLSISYSFEPGAYWYSYYVTSVGTSTNDYSYLIMRWRCNSPVAVAYAYFEDGSGQEIVSFGSQSPDWVTTIIKLRSGNILNEVMIGLTNAVSLQYSGDGTLEISFIMIAGEAI